MEPVTLNWSEAEVKDAELIVPLEGEATKEWRQVFERTVALLGHGDWGEITVKKDRVQVSDVTPGSEDKLKHHLEGVVDQANATVAEDEEEDDSAEDEDEDDPDTEMTERFRSE